MKVGRKTTKVGQEATMKEKVKWFLIGVVVGALGFATFVFFFIRWLEFVT